MTQSVDIYTTSTFIDEVLAREVCKKHKADLGDPCFIIPSMSNDIADHGGVCNRRAVRAGYNGRIQSSSLRTKKNA